MGCSGRLDAKFPAFLRDCWTFDAIRRPGIEGWRLKYGPEVPVVHLRGKREAEAFVRSLAPG